MIRDRIRFCLVRTTHPGNIGATARAMKTMGLENLYLVSPARFPDDQARARAAGGADLLEEVVVTRELTEALDGCQLVLGTTARSRSIEWPTLAPDRACALLVKEAEAGRQVAVVFGTERNGLSNEDVEYCHQLVRIPTAKGYSSLNLAAAVQVIAYEILKHSAEAAVEEGGVRPETWTRADAREMRSFYQHFRQVLIDLDFVKSGHPPVRIMRKLVRLFNRARPDHEELNILRGILTAIQENLKQSPPARR